MTRTIRENLKRLQDNTNRVSAMINIISKKTDEFEKSVAPYRNSILHFEEENRNIMDTQIDVSLSDILQGIAKDLDVDVQDLNVVYKTNIDYKTSTVQPAVSCADRFNQNKKKHQCFMDFDFKITPTNGKTIRFGGTAHSGTKLGENDYIFDHLEARAIPQPDGGAIYKICLLDFDNLILTYNLSALVTIGNNGIEAKSKLANIVIMASDRYETRQKALKEQNTLNN